MGTRTAGDTSIPSGSQINATSGTGLQWKGDAPLTMSEDGYVDNIYVYVWGYPSGCNFKGCLWDLSNNLLVASSQVGAGTTHQYRAMPVSNYFLSNGQQVYGGCWGSSPGSSIETFYPNGHYWLQQTVSGPSNFAGTKDTFGFAGYLAWYISYYPSVSASLGTSHGSQNTNVTVNGQSYSAGVNSVTLNGQSCSFTVNSDTQLVFTVPTGATTGSVVIHTNLNSPTAGTFTVDPSITSISPTHGNTGTNVTITGDGFNSATSVSFYNNVSTTFTVNSDTQIVAPVPSGATTGPIKVSNGSNWDTSSTFSIDVSITSFTPTTGGTGTSVTITGVGFTGASAVKFNGTSATSYTVNSDTQITATVPSGASTGPISVTTAAGTATSSQNFVLAPGWFHSSGTIHRFANIYFKNGGTLHQIKGVWYKNGGTLHPLK